MSCRHLQALKKCKQGQRSVLGLYIEHELAVTCQHCAKGLLQTLLVCPTPHESAAAASNMLRRALDIYKRQQACRSIVPQPLAQGQRNQVTQLTLEHEIWSQVVGIMQQWRLPLGRKTIAEVIADTHLLLMQASSLQLQASAEALTARWVATATCQISVRVHTLFCNEVPNVGGI
jgi:hypothetical protein